MSRDRNYCQFSGNHYSKIGKCARCKIFTAEHFLIDGLCKECYVTELKTYEEESYNLAVGC